MIYFCELGNSWFYNNYLSICRKIQAFKMHKCGNEIDEKETDNSTINFNNSVNGNPRKVHTNSYCQHGQYKDKLRNIKTLFLFSFFDSTVTEDT